MDKLKTLKDFTNIQTNKWNEIHYDKWGEKVLNEKEIIIIDDIPSRFVNFEELREEAIKHIKYLRHMKEFQPIKLLPWITTTDPNNTGLNAIINYIMWANNITEEDLK